MFLNLLQKYDEIDLDQPISDKNIIELIDAVRHKEYLNGLYNLLLSYNFHHDKIPTVPLHYEHKYGIMRGSEIAMILEMYHQLRIKDDVKFEE